MTTMPSRPRRPGWWYPYIFVAGFLVVVAVNVFMMSEAVHTFSGLDSPHAYEEGLAYNKVLAMAEAQRHLGWTVDAQVVPAGAANGEHEADVAVTFHDKDGKPVEGMTVGARFIRPTSAGHDHSVTLQDAGGGRYTAAVKLPLPGLWNMHLTAHRADVDYQIGRRLLIP